MLHSGCASTKLWPRSNGYKAQGIKWSTAGNARKPVGNRSNSVAYLARLPHAAERPICPHRKGRKGDPVCHLSRRGSAGVPNESMPRGRVPRSVRGSAESRTRRLDGGELWRGCSIAWWIIDERECVTCRHFGGSAVASAECSLRRPSGVTASRSYLFGGGDIVAVPFPCRGQQCYYNGLPALVLAQDRFAQGKAKSAANNTR